MQKKQTKRALREHNRKAVLSLLRSSGAISIAEISRKIHLSNNTITKIIEHYQNQDLIVNAGKGNSTYEGGKKPNLFSFNPDAFFAIGMQMHHDEHLYGVLTDLNVRVREEVSLPLKWNTRIETVLERIVEAYRRLLGQGGIDRRKILGLAVGTHGVTDWGRGVILSSPHNPVWGENLPFKKLLKRSIADPIPIVVDNQIRFQTFAERFLGGGQNDESIVVMRCGFGAIAGIMRGNVLQRGKHFLAGSIGHMTVDPHDEEVCSCGGRGCFEVLIGADRVVRKARAGFAQNQHSLIFSETEPDDISIEDIFRASNSDDPFAQKLIDEVAEWFSVAINNIILMYDPDVVIIHGVYSEAGDYLLDTIRTRVNKISLVHIPRATRIEYTHLGKQAGAMGAAAYLIYERFQQDSPVTHARSDLDLPGEAAS
jgi:predicted NBD/HSP70 family sugar kinase